eukprot:TRINITY_DN18894_c0_g1_i1.p1 TRINITY_DN18894_c0_g1~~TRINITY_DN18894_c0_g1_i1.p1  ORF type:complete len:207 (+),score=41.33 TRINITY_DN18894_c0_g1_i1:55-675(+)
MPPTRSSPGAASAFAPLLLLAHAAVVEGWSSGDFVPIFRRSLYDGKVTNWVELGPDLSPRFGHGKSVRLHGLADKAVDVQDFKVAFELGHGLGRKTTWITVQSGCGANSYHDCYALSSLSFDFKYEHGQYGKITDFQWHASYGSKPVEHIHVHYTWKQEHDRDLHFALLVIYTLSVVGGFLLCTLTFASSHSIRKGEMLVRDARSQ